MEGFPGNKVFTIDGSVQFIKEIFPNTILIENKKNLGFAVANNPGIEISKGRYIALLNINTVVDKDWLKNLVIASELSSENTGCGQVRFFHSNLGLRARLAGWKTISAPKAVVYHHYSGTTGKYTSIKAYLVERNHIWLAIKNFPLSKLLFLPLYTFWRYLMQVYGIFRKKGAGVRFLEDFSGSRLLIILFKALWGATKGMPVILKKRRYIQKKKIVTDKEINNLFKRYGITIKELVFKD